MITKEQAIRIYKSGLWEEMPVRDRCALMLKSRLCAYPFEQFHKDIEQCFGRPVFTHELGMNYQGLVDEFDGKVGALSTEDILNLIPEEKRLIVYVPSDE